MRKCAPGGNTLGLGSHNRWARQGWRIQNFWSTIPHSLCVQGLRAQRLYWRSVIWGNPSQVTHHRELPCFHLKDLLLSLPHALFGWKATPNMQWPHPPCHLAPFQGLPLPPSPPPLSCKTGSFWASVKFFFTNVRVGVKIVTSICIFRGAFRGQRL